MIMESLYAFIPYKKSKAGKRFAFVRFIKVDNIDCLVVNLCTIWIGCFHLYANVARFHKERKPSAPSHPSNANKRNSPGSYVSILKLGKTNNVMSDQVLSSLILDDSCILDRDFSLSLMGKVKDITAMPNLYVILEKEGFQNLSLTYLGGLWVLIETVSISAKEKLLNHTGVGSWFSSLKPACNSFVSDERVVWISLEGLPLKVWTRNTFAKVASKWGDLVHGKELEAWDPFICNDSYESESSDDEEDAKYDRSQSGDKVTTNNDVKRVLMISNNVYFIASFIPSFKRRYFKDYYSEDQYAVSIKEDTAYLCLHSPKTTKETRSNTPYPGKAIRRIQAI
ncbi:hypothetical protein Tco_0944793 [Tanacetum coccineum]